MDVVLNLVMAAAWGEVKVMNKILPVLPHRDDLPSMFNNLGLLGHGVEIGVSYGGFAFHLRNTWKGEMLHLVDRWVHVPEWRDSANVDPEKQEEYYRHVCRTFHPARNTQIYRMDSVEASAKFEDKFFDWIYIDADHSYDAVKKDINAWFPKLKPGGVMAGHDYMNGDVWGCYFEVKRAVDEWVKERGIQINTTTEAIDPSWYFRKA